MESIEIPHKDIIRGRSITGPRRAGPGVFHSDVSTGRRRRGRGAPTRNSVHAFVSPRTTADHHGAKERPKVVAWWKACAFRNHLNWLGPRTRASRVAGDLRSPVSRFRLTNGGPRYSGRRKTARATRGREKERERELLVRRIVEDKAIGLGPPLVFKVLEADCYVCCIFEVISFLEEEEEGIRTRKCAGNRLKSLKREVLKRDSSEFYIGYGDTCLRVNF